MPLPEDKRWQTLYDEWVDKALLFIDDSMAGHWNEKTSVPPRIRRYKQLGRIIVDLYLEGRISTTDPAELTYKDIQKFVGFRKGKVKPISQLDDLTFL